MFLSFGKKSASSKKTGNTLESPKTTTSPGMSSPLKMNGTSIGSRATVQTVAGPLLASTRFNTRLDASTYANVNSPGFTSRLVHCASNGSCHHDNSATHQSKYSGIGIFPRVQLGKHSILPVLSARNSQKVARTPVRVRIAPPNLSERRRHSMSCGSTLESKDKVDVFKRSPSLGCQNSSQESGLATKPAENNTSTDKHSETTRKRIFSECQDARDEAKKRRRKSEIPIPNPNGDIYQYRHVCAPAVPASPPPSDISSHGKRAREKGSPEEQKRQRRKICNTNNAIFSSLSSSRNLLERLAAQKRKSADTSRVSSPSTPPVRKRIEENKIMTRVKAVQCNWDENLSGVNVQDAKQKDGTPLSTKAIVKRSVESSAHERNKSSNETQNSSACDYTTKLFRKELPSHMPRTPVSKDKKQSLWVQPPEADELSCSLLSDDSKLDRPERLKSLLARVSGKDSRTSTNQTVTSSASELPKGTSQSSQPAFCLPVSASLKVLSPPSTTLASALTVTVSSTSTIMTSATVTSVNGVPSSESSPPPSRPLQVPSQSSVTSPSMSFSGSTSSSQSTFGQNIVSTASPTGILSPATNVDQIQKVSAASASVALQPSLTFGSTSAPLTNSLSTPTATAGLFGMQSEALLPTTCSSSGAAFTFISNQNSVTTSSPSISSTGALTKVFPMNSPINASESLQIGTSSSNSDLHFGSSSNFSAVGKPAPQFGSGTGGSTEVAKTSIKFGSSSSLLTSPSQPSLGGAVITSASNSSSDLLKIVPNPAQSPFGSNLIAAPQPSFSFGSSTTGSSDTAKPAFQFDSSNSVEVSKPAFQFSSNGGGQGFQMKSPFSLGSNENSSFDSPKIAFNFGSSSARAPKTPKSALPFGLASNGIPAANKPAPQFGSSSIGVSETAKPALQFGSSSNSTAVTQKPPFQFSSSAGKAPEVSKPAIQFGSNLNTTADTSKSPFQFGSSQINSNETPKSPFSFSSNTTQKSQSFSVPTFSSAAQSASCSAFGQVTQQQNKATFSFGSSAQPNTIAASTNQNKTTFSFGSSESAFGSSSSTPTAPTFGSSNGMAAASPFGSSSTPAFGSPPSNTQSTLPSFGSLQEPKNNGFGSTPSFGSQSTNSFNSNSQTSSGSAFQFGNKNSTGSSSFSFGQKQDMTPSAFNFNATVTTVPNGSAQANQAPGLFSIGAGSSTTQRRIREGRRRR